ncbi:piggyBac transposable element-derived protein 3-like [Metopolophium dirhodum]|uniref:piggyBac transposable element-derived protein 3-like n=1 Tax=Metopolophium dirhodum TaxID=44670 RepID=UPI0029902F3B|nr:piggyBac transposable element-derived protein 3-like [Metopolophium dirhodum]
MVNDSTKAKLVPDFRDASRPSLFRQLGGNLLVPIGIVMTVGCYAVGLTTMVTSRPMLGQKMISYNLFTSLDCLGIKAAGTIRLNCFANPPVVSDKELNTLGRGASYEVTSTDGKVGLIKWLDNKSVTLASNFVTSGSPDIIKRYDKKNKSYVVVCRPEIVKLYNDSMGGVDLHDQLISYYRVFIKSRKWTLRMLFHSFDIATCNSWLEYRNDAEAINLPKKKVMDLLGFKQNLASTLISIESSVVTPSRKRGRPSSSNKIIVQPKPRTKNRLIDRYLPY